MHRLRIRETARVLLVAGFSAAAGKTLSAQDAAAPRTHTVKKGDTLWDLSHTYLGDPFLWPEIYRLNTDKIEDPHWIYPGEVLKLPAGGAMLGNAPAAQTSGAAAASVSNPTLPPRQGKTLRMTVFNPDYNKVDRKARESLNLRAGAAAVRPGEHLASPYVVKIGGPEGAGVVEEATEGAGIAMTTANRPMGYLEPMFVHLPKGAVGRVGDEYLVYRRDSLIESQGQVLVPTGVIKLMSPGLNGRTRGQLVKKFEDVFQGQGVAALDTLVIPEGVLPTRIEFGLATRVTWINYDPVLPGSGTYIILGAGSNDGLTPGDQVTLMRNRGEDSKGVALPDEEVAVAQITRVTPQGAAATILRTLQVGVTLGMKARVTAKMP
jgi:LysM repeat protein